MPSRCYCFDVIFGKSLKLEAVSHVFLGLAPILGRAKSGPKDLRSRIGFCQEIRPFGKFRETTENHENISILLTLILDYTIVLRSVILLVCWKYIGTISCLEVEQHSHFRAFAVLRFCSLQTPLSLSCRIRVQ